MCSWITERRDVQGFAKGRQEWTAVDQISVYYDHPNRMTLDHALIIDLSHSTGAIDERARVELTPESARLLIDAIEQALETGAELHDHSAATRVPQ